MAAYLMNFAAWGAGLPFPSLNLIAAAIYFLVNRKKSRFVAFHCFQAFTSQLPTTVLNVNVPQPNSKDVHWLQDHSTRVY